MIEYNGIETLLSESAPSAGLCGIRRAELELYATLVLTLYYLN